MAIELMPTEARVIGCLVEQAITTPEQLPLAERVAQLEAEMAESKAVLHCHGLS